MAHGRRWGTKGRAGLPGDGMAAGDGRASAVAVPLGGRAAVARASSDRTPEGGLAHPPFQGAGCSGSARTLGTCTGIWTLMPLVETREFVAETGGFLPVSAWLE